jgi:gas vesicle protein
MNANKHDIGNMVGGALIGTSLGIVAGILLAPKSGRELRSEFGKRADRTLRKMRHRIQDMID